MKAKLYTESHYINAYGRRVTAYRDAEAKIRVELEYELDGDYWWTKLTHVYGPGRDGALNLTDEQCEALAAIFRQIAKKNKKVAVRDEQA